MSKSPNGMTTPLLCCSPSSFPATIAVSFVYGYTVKSASSSVRNDSRRRRMADVFAAVDEFRQTDCGERCILVTSRVYDSLDELLDRIPTALGSDDHAGVEDQSHAGGFSGSRWLLMTSSRSRAKSPSSVAVEPCSLARRSDSDSNRT